MRGLCTAGFVGAVAGAGVPVADAAGDGVACEDVAGGATAELDLAGVTAEAALPAVTEDAALPAVMAEAVLPGVTAEAVLTCEADGRTKVLPHLGLGQVTRPPVNAAGKVNGCLHEGQVIGPAMRHPGLANMRDSLWRLGTLMLGRRNPCCQHAEHRNTAPWPRGSVRGMAAHDVDARTKKNHARSSNHQSGFTLPTSSRYGVRHRDALLNRWFAKTRQLSSPRSSIDSAQMNGIF